MSEITRHHGGPEVSPSEPEYIEVSEQERSLNEALQLARSFSTTLRPAEADPERQRALRDLIAIVDNRSRKSAPCSKTPITSASSGQPTSNKFRRAFEYLNRSGRTITTEIP